jgi:hypothetical protein
MEQQNNKELDKRFRHHAWFLKSKMTIAEAIEYMAKCHDFFLGKKLSRKQSTNLLEPPSYDDVIYDSECPCHSWRITQIEKDYFLEKRNQYQEDKV